MDSTIKEMEMAGLLPDAVGWYNIISREREDSAPQAPLLVEVEAHLLVPGLTAGIRRRCRK
jgi:hypothetical protein